ncbi:hypothetical protein EGI31_03470, partial [Lacihabitans soyangensis]|nr:hypothetical protein [Lacihabitans soyangensis]
MQLFDKKFSGWINILKITITIVFLNHSNLFAQCTVGTTQVTWEAAASGSQTIIPTVGTAGGPPAAVTDAVPGCTNVNSINPFNFTTTITEVVGNVYDRIRSGTNGLYGQPYLTVVIDNFDGGCTTCDNTTNAPYANGSRIDIRLNFQYPVLLNNLRIDDIDAADIARAPTGQSSFQDVVTVSALSITGTNVPLNLSLGASGFVNLSGQTATAIWTSGVNNNLSENDPAGQLTVSSSQAVTSVTISFIAGSSAISPAQQAIRIGTIDVCCPSLIDITGNVFNECNGLSDNIINGTGLGNPANTTLYANLVEPTTNRVIAVGTVSSNGTYSIVDVPVNTTYNIVLSTTQGVVGNAPPSASLPTGWTNVGENLGSGSGNDGTVNGILTGIVVGTSNITQANFGILNNATQTTVTASSSTTTLCANQSFTLNGTVTNGVLREFFPNISGVLVTDLTSNATYPNSPTVSEILSTTIGPSGIADNYGTRVRYYFTPSTSGSYQFVIYGDDQTTLSWSGSSATSPLTTIASIPDWTNVNELTKYASQTTASLSLTAGTQYYFELLQKEGFGGDHYGILYRLSPSTTFINIPTAELSPVRYSWSGPNGYTSQNLSNTIVNAQPNQSGIYTITTTDFYGCQKTATVNVTVNALPTPTAASNSPVCVGQTINLTSSGGTGYSWSGPGGFTSTLQNPTRTLSTTAMAGTYTVTVTNAAGCTATATTAVVVNTLPIPTAASNSPVCVGQTIN